MINEYNKLGLSCAKLRSSWGKLPLRFNIKFSQIISLLHLPKKIEVVFHLIKNLGRLPFSLKIEVVFHFPKKWRSSSKLSPTVLLLAYLASFYLEMLENKLSRVGGGGWGAGSNENKANSAFKLSLT